MIRENDAEDDLNKTGKPISEVGAGKVISNRVDEDSKTKYVTRWSDVSATDDTVKVSKMNSLNFIFRSWKHSKNAKQLVHNDLELRRSRVHGEITIRSDLNLGLRRATTLRI